MENFYANNNPIMMTDPTGLLFQWINRNIVQPIGSAVTWVYDNTIGVVVGGVRQLGNNINNQIIQPINNRVVQPAVTWTNSNIVQPFASTVSTIWNNTREQVLLPVWNAIGTAGDWVVNSVVRMYNHALDDWANFGRWEREAILSELRAGFLSGLAISFVLNFLYNRRESRRSPQSQRPPSWWIQRPGGFA